MRSVLRVGFDGRDLLRKRTGVVNNAVHLARLLADRRDGAFIAYADGFTDPLVTPPDDVPLRRLNAPPIAWKHVALPIALWRDHVDVFHSPTGTLPLFAACRQVVTVHDLFAAIEPAWFPSPRMSAGLRAAQRRAARAATVVIAVSRRTHDDLVERFGIQPSKIRVVPNGIDHDRFSPAHVEAEAIAHLFGVPHPFILCVGSLMPWRNGPRLLEAAARLKMGLLFVGRDIWGTDPTAHIAAERGWEWARFAGYVDEAALPDLYRAATVFAYPSLYEGFGIPPLEAMASGTPVVASTRGALPEVLGDAALLVDPLDVDGLADALATAVRDPNRLRARGLQHAARFDWRTTAEQTWDVYQQAARRP